MATSRRTTSRRLVRPTTVVAALFLLLVGLVLLAIPFLKAPGNAQGARTDLEAARTLLASGDVAGAEASVQSARRHADQVQDAIDGAYEVAAVPGLGGVVSAWRPNPAGALERRFYVYQRQGEPCRVCGSRVRTRVVGGRNLFWCGRCQRRR